MAKGPSKKKTIKIVWQQNDWKVVIGKLQPGPGRPPKTSHIFSVVAEKLPFESLRAVSKYLIREEVDANGVYMAHDSMGVARYGGRGKIISRLAKHKKDYPKQLLYFSFYIIANKSHEREIETAILRAAGGQMNLNERKIREGIAVGNVSDFEPGTYFFERRSKRMTKAMIAEQKRLLNIHL